MTKAERAVAIANGGKGMTALAYIEILETHIEALEAVVEAVKKRHAPLTGENFYQRIWDGGKELNEALAALQRLQERG